MTIGRPREFDVEKALDKALKLFWKKGYEGTSLPDLTKAMGINRPSLYAAFGNKEALFRKTIDCYIDGPASHVRESLNLPSARATVDGLLNGNIEMITDAKNPKGCFMVQSALACGTAGDAMRRELIKRRAALEVALRERFERAVTEGDLPASANAADLAKFVVVIANGLAVQAAGGATREELIKAKEIAMRAWPT